MEALGNLICSKCLVTVVIVSAWEFMKGGFFFLRINNFRGLQSYGGGHNVSDREVGRAGK